MMRRVCAVLALCGFFFGGMRADSTISTGRAIAAYGSNGAYLITTDNELYQWNPTFLKWTLGGTIAGNKIRQMDCLHNGTNLVGTDDNNDARKWNEASGTSAAFSIEQSGTKFDWVILDPVTDATKGKLFGLPGWTTWNVPTLGGGDDWYKYLPVGVSGTAKATPQYVVDKTSSGIHRWEREDVPYRVTLNQAGASTPFNIYYFGPSESSALGRITDPPTATTNIDDVDVKQISYDEDNQNLWSVDNYGRPWRWDNTEGQWILSNTRGEVPGENYTDISSYLRVYRDFYVRTTYVDGSFRPLLIIFRDSLLMQLVLGTLSLDNVLNPEVVILDDLDRGPSAGGPILLQPRERPKQFVVRDGSIRVREDGYLETLLLRNAIISSVDDINLYPGREFRIRR